MTTNRIDEILSEVRQEIAEKVANGKFGAGYIEQVEDGHNSQLGKLAPEVEEDISPLVAALSRLREQVDGLSAIERDHVKFAPLRFIRELAMSRHQLIRMNSEVREIASTIEEIAATIVESAVTRTQANERAAQDLLNLVYERTLVMDKLIVICHELEARIEKLEK